MPLPIDIEDVLVNAVYHRGYEERGPVEVCMLPDRITIASFPGRQRPRSRADLQTGSFVTRRYRNPRIGELLEELRLTESRGTGVPRILRAVRANGSPAEFLADEDRTSLVTVLPVHSEFGSADRGATPQVTTEVTAQVATEVTRRERELLELCTRPRERTGIMRLGLIDPQHVRRRYLRPLLDRGLLEMTRPESPRSPTQRYRTAPLDALILGDSTAPVEDK